MAQMKILSLFAHPQLIPNFLSPVEHEMRYFEECSSCFLKKVNGVKNNNEPKKSTFLFNTV